MPSLKHTFDALDPSDPSGLQRRLVGLEGWQLESLLKNPHPARLARLALAKEVCSAPEWVFEGLQRPDQDWSFCYVGRPASDWRATDIETPPPPGTVFLVFATQRGKLTDWRWEDVDQDGSGLPENYRTRFGRMLWPHQQTFSPNGPGEVLASETSTHTPSMGQKKMR